MKIVDILIDSASLLGLYEEVAIISSTEPENEAEILEKNKNIHSLFNLIKFSIRELCTNYVPMVSDVRIKTENKTFALSSIENYIRVQNITENGNMIKFKIISRNIIFDHDGEYVVSYETYPTISSVFEDIDFLDNFSPDVMVMGLCSYFSLAHGRFDEFQEFHEKYVSKAESLKHLKSFSLPTRRWE